MPKNNVSYDIWLKNIHIGMDKKYSKFSRGSWETMLANFRETFCYQKLILLVF